MRKKTLQMIGKKIGYSIEVSRSLRSDSGYNSMVSADVDINWMMQANY